jgi:acyl-coenzyme A thioesterase PaaI-like protein
MSEESFTEAMRRIQPPQDAHHLMGRGHPVGDILEAYEWRILQRSLGRLRVSAHVTKAVRNPRGQLFGGFTGTYIDFMSIFIFWSGRETEHSENRGWLSTLNMRVDYFRPITGPRFEMDGQVVYRQGGTGMIEIRFYDSASESIDGSNATSSPEPSSSFDSERPPLAYGYTTMKVSG